MKKFLIFCLVIFLLYCIGQSMDDKQVSKDKQTLEKNLDEVKKY